MSIKHCEFNDCQKRATYGKRNGVPIMCIEHKGIYKKHSRLCYCGLSYPNFNCLGISGAYCSKCKSSDMIDVRHKKCEKENCNIQPTYNFENETTPRFCINHKLDDMVDIKHKKCQHQGCNIRPSYNFENENKPKFCVEHKFDGMFDIISSRCENANCKKKPSFNYENETIARFCAKHKMENMVDISHKKCENPGCNIQPTFNYDGETIAKYCVEHKLDRMVNVKGKKCEHTGCNTKPSFNFEGEPSPKFCAEHKLDRMINITINICEYENCKTTAGFNYENETIARFCAKHKFDGMIDVINEKCENINCSRLPSYNFPNDKKRRFCVKHKLDGMISNLATICKSNAKCENYGYEKYDGHCSFCFQHYFPDDERTNQMRVKTKELVVKDYIDEHFDGFIHDQPLYTHNCDCSHRRRIDFRKLINNTLLCIEVDEFQHKGYVKEDEEIRYNDVFMIHGGKFIFIRFNPDKYKNKKGEVYDPRLIERLPNLRNEIEKQMSRIENEENDELLEIVKLYYDK